MTATKPHCADAPTSTSWENRFRSLIIGQDLGEIIDTVKIFKAGFSPEGRPPGVFLLTGPTGSGKTRTVEALADALHGSEKHLLRIDCGEFQMEHEVAKLIGAPPGYIGHRETQPILTQQKLLAVTSGKCAISIVLFDEIEKAAPSMHRIMLGIMDMATLRLGDGNTVNFERTLIFMTSNLGAREISALSKPLGFAMCAGASGGDIRRITKSASGRMFSPEFMNRIDSVLSYRALTRSDLLTILDMEMKRAFTNKSFLVSVSDAARGKIIDNSMSDSSGAREVRREIQRRITRPMAKAALSSGATFGSFSVDLDASGEIAVTQQG